MRLSPEQKKSFLKVVRGHFGYNADVYVFGSQLDDSCKGGNVNILVQVETPVSRMTHARLVLDLEEELGLAVDVPS